MGFRYITPLKFLNDAIVRSFMIQSLVRYLVTYQTYFYLLKQSHNYKDYLPTAKVSKDALGFLLCGLSSLDFTPFTRETKLIWKRHNML